MEITRKFTGVFIPCELWEDTKLNWTEKCFLGEIEALSGRGKGCFASNEYLSQSFGGTTPGNVAVMLSKLRKLGYIEDRKGDKGERLLIVVTMTPPKIIEEKPEAQAEPVKKTDAEAKAGEDKMAESIYNTYPRKVGKPNALKKIKKALASVGFDKLERLTREYSDLWHDADKKQLAFCPHPATWFHQERYNDPPEQWQGPKEERETKETKRESEKPGASGKGWDREEFHATR